MFSPITEVDIVLDKPRKLRYTNYSSIMFEKEMQKLTGKKTTLPAFLSALRNAAVTNDDDTTVSTDKMLDAIGITELIILLWAGLVSSDKKLTWEYIAENTSFVDYAQIFNYIMQALIVASPQSPEDSSTQEGTESPLESTATL